MGKDISTALEELRPHFFALEQSLEEATHCLININSFLQAVQNSWLLKGEHDPTQCRYYVKDVYHKQGCCLGTKEIDPCDGPDCKRWKPKEDA